jgi:hypothetical protein
MVRSGLQRPPERLGNLKETTMIGYVSGWAVIERLLDEATDEAAFTYRLTNPPTDFVRMREWWRLVALTAWRTAPTPPAPA